MYHYVNLHILYLYILVVAGCPRKIQCLQKEVEHGKRIIMTNGKIYKTGVSRGLMDTPSLLDFNLVRRSFSKQFGEVGEDRYRGCLPKLSFP